MKFLNILCLTFLFMINSVSANHYIVSPNHPVFPTGDASPPLSNQSFFLWSRDSGCYTTNYTVEPETLVSVIENDIRVFFKAGLGGDSICVSPPPPIYLQRATINRLNVDSYNLSTYHIPYGNVFPPAIDDYPIYLDENIQFNVVYGGPVVVDSTTNVGLIIFIFMVLSTGLYFRKKKFL